MRLLIIEDDELAIAVLRSLLREHEADYFPSLQDFLATAKSARRYDLALIDLCHPGDPKGLQTPGQIGQLLAREPNLDVLVQSGLNDIQIMRECLKHGAQNFLFKEHLPDELPAQLGIYAEYKKMHEELGRAILGDSRLARDLKRQLFRLRLDRSADVLIEGETGSGKELCARALAGEGDEFVAVNVSSLSRDLFESEIFGSEKGAFTGAQGVRAGFLGEAGSGILFLDEIQSLHLDNQVKLLRLIENREYYRVGSSRARQFSGRLVFASNRSLWDMVEKGQFREDLYYRVHSHKVAVPPLRQRRQDIPLLITHGLSKLKGAKKQFTPDAIELLQNHYDWPGNIRELFLILSQVVQSARMPLIGAEEVQPLLKDKIRLGDVLPADIAAPVATEGPYAIDWSKGFDENCRLFETHIMQQAQKKYGLERMKEVLDLPKTRFYQKLKLISP